MTTPFRADLHCHSYFSDGTDSPETLIILAKEQGLAGLSITDHDTCAAYPEAFELAKLHQIHLLAGIELSASLRGEPVHVLGYAIDVQNEVLQGLCHKHRSRRHARNLKILTNLRRLGIEIAVDIEKESEREGSFGRPHIARFLVQQGVVSTIQEAFDLFLGEGKRAFDPGEPISVEETLSVIKQAGGKAILAHPHLLKKSTTIREVLQLPFDGLEGYYARMSPQQEQKWIDIAKNKGWLVTGGSDYHGETKPHSRLGSSWVDKTTFEALYAR